MKKLIKAVAAKAIYTSRVVTHRVFETVKPSEASIAEYRKDPEAYQQKRLGAFIDVHSNFGFYSFGCYVISGRNRKVAQTVALTGLVISLTHVYDLANVRYHANKLDHSAE